MPIVTLTDSTIRDLPRPEDNKQVLYWDTHYKGLGVLVSGRTNTRTFVLQNGFRIGTTRIEKRITLGRTEVFSMEEAVNMFKVNSRKLAKYKAELRMKEIMEADIYDT